jgi:hypothetical protein
LCARHKVSNRPRSAPGLRRFGSVDPACARVSILISTEGYSNT